MSSIRVLLVDDQEIIRQGLATILKYAPGIEVVGQAGNGNEAVAQARALRPDVVLMDPKMPQLGGIPREEEVLHLLVEGLSNKEIGDRLHLTEGTVKNYVSTIIGKLQANDRTHAVVTALRHGLVEL